MEDVSQLVARQYEAFAYPEPFTDIAEAIAKGYHQIGDPALFGPVLWPRGKPNRSLRILVAGCGTVQGACIAFTNRDDEVVGIDLSEASLAHERFLQERHELSNLMLYRGDLLEVGSLGGTFDVIISTGVLHHLADPPAGLSGLKKVLAPEGVMVLMVYGETVRTGVYMLQDAFRRMGIRQTSEGVAQVRRILGELPGRHFAQNYIRAADELKDDAALVDTFLHPQDRAYTVPQVMDLVEGAGLKFQNWVDNNSYWRNAVWDPESAIAQAVDKLPSKEHWSAVEMLRQSAGFHLFTARNSGADLAIVDFERDDWRDFTPHHAPGLSRSGQGMFKRGGYELPCSELEQFVLDGADGKRTIGAIVDVPALNAVEHRDEFARRYFEHLWRLGHVMIELP